MSDWPDSESTQELLSGAREGKSEAVERLLERHRQALRRMIQLRMDPRLARRIDASDIVQDVMIEANRRLSEYAQDPAMPFQLWLRQMARDRIIDAHRRHRLAARRSIDREQPIAVNLPDDKSSHDLAAQLSDGQLTPAANATWHELAQRFEEACGKLESQDQEIVIMRHFEEMSNSEVAEVLGLSAQAASMRYLRAMRRLRQLMNPEDFTDESAT